MMLILAIFSYLIGYVGTEVNIGCVKMAVINGNFTCADRMQSIFIIEAYMVNRHGCHNDNLRKPEYQTLKAEITNFMKITCNARTECNFYKSLLLFNNNIREDQEYPYVIDYSCEWLYPVTPIFHGWHEKVYSASGNQFVLQSKNYPSDNAPAVDTDCDISFQPQSDEFVIVNLKDLHINGAFNGGSESDINKYCIKSTSTECMPPGSTSSLRTSGSISLQKTSAVTHVRYYMLIYVSQSGSINSKPLNRTFSLNCSNAALEGPGALTLTQTYVPPSIATAPTLAPAAPTSNPAEPGTSPGRIFATTEKGSSSIAAVAGGTVSGIILIALSVLLYFLWRRSKRKNVEGSARPQSTDIAEMEEQEHHYEPLRKGQPKKERESTCDSITPYAVYSIDDDYLH